MTEPREPYVSLPHGSIAADRDDAADVLAGRFEALALASAPFAPILWTTPADGLVDTMPAWCAFTGQSPEDIRGWGWLEAVHPDDRERAAEAWRRALASGEMYETTFRVHRADGVFRVITDRGAPVRDRDGRIREWVGVSTDITDLREAERRQNVQYAVSRVLAEGTSFDAVAHALVETIGDALGWDVGVFWSLDPAADALRPLALRRATTNAARPFEAASLSSTMARGIGLPGRVWASGEPTWLTEVLDDSNFPRVREARAAGLQTAFAFPIRGRSGVLGVMEFFSVQQEPPNAELLRTVAALGNSIGQFLERTRAEEAVRASEARTRAMLRAALDCIITIDAQGRIVEFNPAAEATFGYCRDEVIGAPLAERIIPPELRAQHTEGLARYLATGEGTLLGRRIETTAMRADGTLFPIELALTQIEWDGPPLFTAYLRDISERIRLQRRTHEALDALLEMAQALVEVPAAAPAPGATGAPAWVPGSAAVAHRLAELTHNVLGCQQLSIASIDPETEVMHPLALIGFTPEQERIWWAGWQPDTTVTTRLGAEVAARMRADVVTVLDATAPGHRDRLRPFGVSTLLLVPAHIRGQLTGGLALNFAQAGEDISPETRTMAVAVAKLVGLIIERERLLREREEARASVLALEVANQRMNEFLGIASHELRTPLTTIKANLQLAERRVLAFSGENQLGGSLEDELGRLHLILSRASLAVTRQERLVHDLLDVSRIQQGKMEMRRESLDLAQVVRDVVEEHVVQYGDRTITLTLPEGTVPVWADAMRIGQVVTNYLTNALKYSETAEPVHVSLRREAGGACLRVTDAGPGLPAEEREHVWEQFHRVPGIEVVSGSGVGLGLGLYISKSIVERHGGAVGVESELGAGSTFWFTLPLSSQVSSQVSSQGGA